MNDKETSGYTLTVTPNDGSLYVHVECQSCKDKDARIAEMEAENERLRSTPAINVTVSSEMTAPQVERAIAAALRSSCRARMGREI